MIKHLFLLFYVWFIGRCKATLMLSNFTIKLLYLPGFNSLRHFNAMAKAYAEFVKARNRVPAYLEFLNSKQFSGPTFNGIIPNLNEIPITDKENYVKPYALDQRCVNGKIPDAGVIIDESSGSSGKATNWARGKRERNANAQMIKFGMHNLFGDGPVFIINAFALGAWATGINITMSCIKFAKIKAVGPDKIKIENTISHFGKQHRYVIMGYPPFLKLLVDDTKINWKELDVSFILGGESMAEEMRDYLIARGIKKIYSSLGASDLELNLAAENDFTISLRRLLRSNAAFRNRVLKYPGALPMVFQYNPADFLIDVNEIGELIFTVCRPGYIAPKIRYNLHDKGHILQQSQLRAIVKELGIKASELAKSPTDLPLLFHYGRADLAVSFFGANISPVDIQETLYKFPQLVNAINSFYLSTPEDGEGNKQFIVAFEAQQHKEGKLLNLKQIEQVFFDELAHVNQDFREACNMLANPQQMQIALYGFGEGPFKNADLRVKAKYVSC